VIGELPDAPLDIIGDIHGEADALNSLLYHLGYDEKDRHAGGRKLVFVGDLCDRGPDSPGVIETVRRLIDSGQAQAILGNHELNLLRQERKDGNDWYWDEATPRDGKYEPYSRLHIQQRESVQRFIAQLPLALERADLRIVHAAWHDNSFKKLATENTSQLPQLFDSLDKSIDAQLDIEGLLSQSQAEKEAWRHALHDSAQEVPLLRATGLCEERRQMGNPIRVVTSGMERLAQEPFYSSGKWRFADRVKWWDEYSANIPVVVGHYWRQYKPIDRKGLGKGDPNLFETIAPTHWHGAQGNVFCVDFSVGGRFQERRPGQIPGSTTKLAALRWPERTLVLDSGETINTGGYGG
jgi:hypothetical protein